MQMKKTTLRTARPFSLKATVLSHGWHECAPMSWCEGGRCYQSVERAADRVYRVSVVEGRRTEAAVTLRVMVEGDEISDEVVAGIRRNLRTVLGLDQDLSEFYELCRRHPTLHVLREIGAGRGVRSACMVENTIKMICGTNVNWTQSVKMINRLAQLGPNLPHFRNLNAWPTPREILRAGRTYLTDICRVGYRADSILALCEDVCERRFDPTELDAMAASDDVTGDELLSRLLAIRGVGPASAHNLLSFLGRHDRLSIDSSTVAHVARTHTNGRKPSLRKIERIYAKYGRWKNKVWWFEQWLNWSTAKQLLAEAGPTAHRP